MSLTDAQLKEVAVGSEEWLRSRIDDAEVDKTVGLIHSMNSGGEGTTLTLEAVPNDTVSGVTGSSLCVVFYWRISLTTPDGHTYTGNAGGVGGAGAGAIQGGVLKGVPDMNTLYSKAVSFQFNSAAAALNVNFFDSNSQLVGTFIGGGVGICLGTGGGSGTWSPS